MISAPRTASSTSDVSSHTFHVGANYRFGMQNGGGAAFEVPAYNWTGFYVGGALGAGAVVHELNVRRSLGGLEFNGLGGEGIFGELNAGYDYDFGSLVAGVRSTAAIPASRPSSSWRRPRRSALDADYGFDVLARAGMKLNESTLAYVARRLQLAAFRHRIPSVIGPVTTSIGTPAASASAAVSKLL